MSNKRSSETQDANLFSPKRNQRKQIPFPTPPHNNAPQPGFSLQQTALPPHPMPVPYQNNLVLPQPSNALATAYQGPESVPNPSTNWTSQSSSTQSGAVVQVKNPVVPSHGGESGPTSLPTKRQKLGKDISIPQVVAHSHWIGNIKENTWAEDKMFIQRLVDAKDQTVVFLLFGTINVAQCGIYGDYVPQFRDSITKSNMKWILRCPQEQTAKFSEQIEAMKRISNTIEKNFAQNGQTKQRPNKNDAEFEIRCKLAKKRKEGSTIVKPKDINGENYWSVCSEAGYEPNVLQNGVYDYEGRAIGFEDYQTVLKPGVNVVVAAKMQAAFFDKTPFVQIIPLKIQVFGKEEDEEEAIPDIF